MTKITWKAPLLASSIALALAGCSDDGSSNSSSDGGSEPIQFSGLTTPVNITFTSTDGEQLEDVTFTIDSNELEVQGAEEDDERYVQEQAAVSISRASNGQVDAISFKIVASAEDHFSNSATIEMPAIADVNSPNDIVGNYTITLTPKEPQGEEIAASFAEETIEASDDGKVAEAITITTPPASDGAANQQAMAGASAELDIPVGTTLLDSDGNPVTGEIKASVVHYSNEPVDNFDELGATSALDAFPGGLSPNGVLDEDGNELGDIAFISAGFTAIEISNEEGQVVKDMQGAPVNLTMNIPQDTINPETGAKVQPGETIPLWSYDELEGQWKAEGTATVGALDPETGTYPITKEITHLSYYNFDWYGTERCNLKLNVVNQNGEDNDTRLGLVLRRPGGGYSLTTIMNRYDGFDTLILNRVPDVIAGNKVQGDIAFFDPQDPTNKNLLTAAHDGNGQAVPVVNGLLTTSLCDFGDGELTVNTADIPEPVDATVNFIAQCGDDDDNDDIKGYFYAYSNIDGKLRYLSSGYADDDGAELDDLYPGKSYVLRGYVYNEDIGFQSLGEKEFVASVDDNVFTFTYQREDDECGTGATGSGSGSGGSNGGAGG
uniref:hypothetical protein n=1 Tax=Thaumasiovibrio occultus TaxID=1891184 RepID=UPI000B3502DB|nr:hypothetical protein [Thaumasiovibrio occultus]